MISVETSSNEGQWTIGISEILGMLSALDLNLKISDRTIVTSIRNTGDDYTSYLDYKMYIYIKYGDEVPVLLKEKKVSLNQKIEVGKTITDSTYFELTVSDYGEDYLKRILAGFKNKEYIIEYEILSYENF